MQHKHRDAYNTHTQKKEKKTNTQTICEMEVRIYKKDTHTSAHTYTSECVAILSKWHRIESRVTEWLTVAADCLFGCLHCQLTHIHRESIIFARTHTHTQTERLCSKCSQGCASRLKGWLIPVCSVTVHNRGFDFAVTRLFDLLSVHMYFCYLVKYSKSSLNALLQCCSQPSWSYFEIYIWEIFLFAFLQRIRWEDWYRSHVCAKSS